MNLLTQTRSYERPYLNERPLYLRSVFYLLAVIQSLVHLVYDYDQIRLPAPKPYSKSPSRGPDNAVLSPRERLRSDLPQRAQAAVLRCLALAVLGPLVYSLFLRRMVWEWTSFAVRVSNYIPKSSSAPPSTPPYRFPLIVRSVLSGYLLVILWETAAVAFEAFFAQEPLKSSVPLTNDCRDQNGTLLTGLKSKREIPQVVHPVSYIAHYANASKTFAFWELGLICHEFPERRKTIFEEIDRKGGSTWSQTLNASLGVLQSLDSRIKAALSPPTQQPTPANQPQPGSLQALPRITPPIKQEPIYAGTRPPQTRRERIEVTVGSFARSHGKTPAPTKNDATPLALSKRLSSYVLDKSLSPRQKQILSYSYIKSKTHGYVLDFLRSPLGVPFQRTLDRRAAAIVLGSPTGDAGVLVDAIEAVTVLASHSLKEDTYGKVQQDVPSIVRALTGSINQLELLQQSLQPHWTDVEADQRDRAHDLSDVVFLLHHLRASLTQIINDFGRYAHNVGIGAKELRAAKRAAGIELEEQEEDEVPPNGRQRRGR